LCLDPRADIGRMLIVVGIVPAALGLAIMGSGHLPFFGRLPGGFHFEGKNRSVHVPHMTGLVLSIVLTILPNLFFRR